eukprot:7062683-Karenia_brevis.AAC.1
MLLPNALQHNSMNHCGANHAVLEMGNLQQARLYELGNAHTWEFTKKSFSSTCYLLTLLNTSDEKLRWHS